MAFSPQALINKEGKKTPNQRAVAGYDCTNSAW